MICLRFFIRRDVDEDWRDMPLCYCLVEVIYLIQRAGRSIHVMTFEVGAVLEDEKWQAPVYCFEKEKAQRDLRSEYKADVGYFEPQLKGILGGSMPL